MPRAPGSVCRPGYPRVAAIALSAIVSASAACGGSGSAMSVGGNGGGGGSGGAAGSGGAGGIPGRGGASGATVTPIDVPGSPTDPIAAAPNAVCDAVATWWTANQAALIQAGCAFFAAATVSQQNLQPNQAALACDLATSLCVSNPDLASMVPMPDLAQCQMGAATCQATVGEFETCFNDTLVLFSALPGCESLSSGMPPALDPAALEPASCTTLNQQCPGVF